MRGAFLQDAEDVVPYAQTTKFALAREGKRSRSTFANSRTAEGNSLGGVVIRRGRTGK